jgi:O-antigen ligase
MSGKRSPLAEIGVSIAAFGLGRAAPLHMKPLRISDSLFASSSGARGLSGAPSVALATACAVAGGALVAYGSRLVNPHELLLWGAAALFTGAIVLLAVLRFDLAILASIAIRISLDGFKSSQSTAISPGTAIGAVFIVLAILHLAGKLLNGEYRPASTATKSLYALAGVAALSSVTSTHPGTAAISAAQILSGALMFAVIEQELRANTTLARRLLITVFISAAIPFAAGLFQVVTNSGNHDITPGFNRVLGTAVHPTPFASYLSIIVLASLATIALAKRHRGLLLGIFVLGMFLLFNTYTRGAWLAVAVGILYLGAKLRLRLALPLTLIGLAGFVVVPEILLRFHGALGTGATPESSSLVWRLNYWEELVPLAAHNPLTGIGLGVTQLVTAQGAQPHDMIIQAYVELGIVGVLALFGVVIGFWHTLRIRVKEATTTEASVFAALAIAIALTLAVDGLSSNILTQAMLYWYFAAAALFGFRSEPGRSIIQESLGVSRAPTALPIGASLSGQID